MASESFLYLAAVVLPMPKVFRLIPVCNIHLPVNHLLICQIFFPGLREKGWPGNYECLMGLARL